MGGSAATAGLPGGVFVLHQLIVPRSRALHAAGVRSRHPEQQPGDAAGAARRYRRRAGDPAVARLRTQPPAEPGRQHHRRAPVAAGRERHRGENGARTAQRRRGRHPRRRGPAQRVLRQRFDRAVRCSVGAWCTCRDLGCSIRPWASVPAAAAMRHARPGVAQRRVSRAGWRACKRKGAAPPSTWRARCATRRCCRRSA